MKNVILFFAIAILASFAPAPDRIITGLITDSNNEPLPGVNVVIKGTTKGITTNAHGRYSITLPREATSLQFSFIGYQTQEIMVSAIPVINVTMLPDSQAFNETVVVYYGIQSKKPLTGTEAH